MDSDHEEKIKRNHPCECCRTLRRKCIAIPGTSCERCRYYELPCIFKFTLKPPKPPKIKPVKKKKPPLSERRRLIMQVQQLHDEAAVMEEQLKSLGVSVCLSPKSQTHENRLPVDQSWAKSREHPTWHLVISHSSSGGLCLQTSIKTLGDVVSFLKQSLPLFYTASPQFGPSPFGHASQAVLVVTTPMLRFERIFRDLCLQRQFGEQDAMSLTAPYYDQLQLHLAKQRIIQIYFDCYGLLNPALIKAYYLDYLYTHPDSMLANATIAVALIRLCHHMNTIPLPIPRLALADVCYETAREQLEDALFENQPSVETQTTLCLLSEYCLFKLKFGQSRTYTSLAWHMTVQLKDECLALLKNPEKRNSVPMTDWIKAETWRRVFFTVRYWELTMSMMYDDAIDYSNILDHCNIGYPTLLPCEYQDAAICHAVKLFQHLTSLSILPCTGKSKRAEMASMRLVAGRLHAIRRDDMHFVEQQLIYFWHQLPPEYRLASNPLDLLCSTQVMECQDPHVLFLNEMYYLYWLNIQIRVIKPPAQADTTGTTVDRLDGERALVLTSVCCDAVVKLTLALQVRWPCVIELYWLVLISDALMILKDAVDPIISVRAQDNLKSTMSLLRCLLEQFPKQPQDLFANVSYTEPMVVGNFMDALQDLLKAYCND